MQYKYLNNTSFIFRFIGGITIITHAIFMKMRKVHSMNFILCELIGYRVSVLRHPECPY